MKKIVSILCGILLASMFFVLLKSFYDKKISTGSISERAKLYLNKQKQNDNGEWSAVSSDEKANSKPDNRSFQVKDCLSFNVPFPVLTVKQEKPCFMMITTSSPRGHIRVYRTTTTHDSLDDVGDITMRRQDKNLYKEETVNVNNKSFLLFKRIDEFSYENVAFYLRNKDIFIISMSYPTSENLDKDMLVLVHSLQILQP